MQNSKTEEVNKVFIDLETRSRVSLREAGAARYARAPSTEVLCVAVKRNDDPTLVYIPSRFNVRPEGRFIKIPKEELIDILLSADEIWAHNLEFEYEIWNAKMRGLELSDPAIFPKLRDTMAICAYRALPRSLENAAKALGLPVEKDMQGNRIMQRMCKPGRDGEFPWNPEMPFR